MGLKRLLSLRDYWRTDELGVEFVREAMSRDRYEEIRQNLHFSNNLDPLLVDYKAAKFQPLIDHFNIIYQRSAEIVSDHSIDEHMVKFKGHNSMKQYVQNKPIKWGFKFWLRCDAATGYIYQFELYTGRKESPEIGLGENVVLQLTKPLIRTGCTVFADNYFSSPTVAALLRDKGLNYIGVVRKDRKGLPCFTNDKKMERGSFEMFYSAEENLMAVKWIDNKPVHLISSIINSNMSNAEPRLKRVCEKVKVDCPDPVKLYNRSMGGADIRYTDSHNLEQTGF